MNIGIYFNNTSESEPLYKALQRVNEGLSEGTLRDASIFYDDSGPNSIPSKCGFFDAVELWHFTGDLITTSLSTTNKVRNIVNKFDTVFYYGWYDERDPLELIRVANDKNIKVVCNSQTSKNQFVRLTGQEPDAVVQDFDLEKIIEVKK
tara:strand:+ start:298 stop:744 length:447 start_codon:yes stop_codon:yes gene_type:complete